MKANNKDTENFQGLIELAEKFPDEKTCREYFADKRWHGKIICPHCGNYKKKIYEFKSRGLYKCSNCDKQFTVKVGTIFEGSKLPLKKWFYAIYLITSRKKGISSLQLSGDLKITQKSAWFMLHRIRYAIRTKTFWNAPLNGVVEADETLIGGKEKFKHADKKIKGSQGRSSKGKTTVFGLAQREGKVIAQTVKNSAQESLHPVIIENVSQDTTLMTDEWRGYNGLRLIYNHKRVNHSSGEYVVGDAHTNNIENFWSLLKRGIIGTFHYISPKHCDKYIDEFEYRYNTRKITDKNRFDLMLNNSESRLKYSQLIA